MKASQVRRGSTSLLLGVLIFISACGQTGDQTGPRSAKEIVDDGKSQFEAVPKPTESETISIQELAERGADNGEVFFKKCEPGKPGLCAWVALQESTTSGGTNFWMCFNPDGMDRNGMKCELTGVQ